MRRLASDVISKLLAEKQKIVTTFPPSVLDTGNTIDELISGTAVFPGGSGLWRGPDCFGELPELFPESPIMFVGHNFDSEDGYHDSKKRGGEKQNLPNFWGVLLAYLLHANIQPSDCFFTNALMGLKPGRSTGPMPKAQGPEYEDQCSLFLQKQIEIVEPKIIVALGREAFKRIRRIKISLDWQQFMHPSAREFKPLITRKDRIFAQGQAIREFLINASATAKQLDT